MVTPLKRNERVFVAGCIKSMLLSNGATGNGENTELDVLIARLKFEDFEGCLAEFESRVKDEESFWDMATKIKRAEARDIILESLREIMLDGRVPGESGEHLLGRLKQAWTT